MSKFIKKGRNSNVGPLDFWLDGLGYYRKNVAYDETCLFRAISEQLFSCQLFHEKVRTACVEYALDNYNEFKDLVETKEEWKHRMNLLSKHMVICGDAEIRIISSLYKRNVIIFNGNELFTSEIENKLYEKELNLYLCFMGEDHYDVVYKREYISTAGFCQSIVYNVLYESVFHMEQVSEIVDNMLYDKPTSSNITDEIGKKLAILDETNQNSYDLAEMRINLATNVEQSVARELFPLVRPECSTEGEDVGKQWIESKAQTQKLQLCLIPQIKKNYMEVNDSVAILSDLDQMSQKTEKSGSELELSAASAILTDLEMLICAKVAPFPYKVAKALDPTIYRNIEYDTWTEVRKEMRLGDWYYGDNNFKQGTCCRLKVDGTAMQCYIQKINKETCDVFIINLAERRTVKMIELLAEEDAKPWPIPYRFTKNSVILSTELVDKFKRNRKRKDKKRTTSNGSSNPGIEESNLSNPYEGCPLVHQTTTTDIPNPNTTLVPTTLNHHQHPPSPLILHPHNLDYHPPPPHILLPTTPSTSCSTLPTPGGAPLTPITSPPLGYTLGYPGPAPQQPLYTHHVTSPVYTGGGVGSSVGNTNSGNINNDNSGMVMWESYWDPSMPMSPVDGQGQMLWSPPPVQVGQHQLVGHDGSGGVITPLTPIYGGYSNDSGVELAKEAGEVDYGQDPHYYYDNYGYGVWTNASESPDQGVPGSPIDLGPPAEYGYLVPQQGYGGGRTILSPCSPQIEMYHPLYHHPSPGTPILYTTSPGPPPPSPQTLLTHSSPTPPSEYHDHYHLHHVSSPHHYSSPDVPYIPTPTYAYPPTPSWYPPGINSQGFIFPAVVTATGGGSGGVGVATVTSTTLSQQQSPQVVTCGGVVVAAQQQQMPQVTTIM